MKNQNNQGFQTGESVAASKGKSVCCGLGCRFLVPVALVILQISVFLVLNGSEKFLSNDSIQKRFFDAPSISKAKAKTAITSEFTSKMIADAKSMYRSSINGSENLWDASKSIPQWMKSYFQWHKEQIAKLNENTWKDMRFLVVQCLREDPQCGGTADRLKPIPTLILLANETQRILLIRWGRPSKLEDFLLPPLGGMDWRVPDWMEPKLPRKPFATSLRIAQTLTRSKSQVAITRYQSGNYGSIYFDEIHNGTGVSFESVYHDLWKVVFTPIPPIAAMIKNTLNDLHLVPGQYAAAHLRALYARKTRDAGETQKWAITAVNCASQLNPGSPVYFASDSGYALKSIRNYASKTSRHIATLQDDESPLHLEKAANWSTRHPSEYYSTFRDLYLLGMSHCVSYNVGGFGNWGLLLSDDQACGMVYSTGRGMREMIPCAWNDSRKSPNTTDVSNKSSFLEPPINWATFLLKYNVYLNENHDEIESTDNRK